MATSQVTARRQQELQDTYTNYKTALQQIAQRIGDVEQEAEEHKYDYDHDHAFCLAASSSMLTRFARLVLDTLKPLNGDRKCFRMINGVLIERTAKDVIPALQTNSEGLSKVLEDLVKSYKKQQDDMEKWKKKNNIQVVQQ